MAQICGNANLRIGVVLRVTEGYPVAHDSSIEGEIDFFQQAVRTGAGRVEVYGMPIGSGIPGGGTWSHAKLFAVYSLPDGPFKALFGGQNHWADYDNIRPPFDSNTMVTGQAATLSALQLDAACKWFDDGRSWLGRNVWFRASDSTVRAFSGISP